MASSSGGKRVFNPQKWVPLRPQDMKPDHMMGAQRGKLPPLEHKTGVEPMSVFTRSISPRRSFVSHPANYLESDSAQAGGGAGSSDQSQFRSQFIPPRPEVSDSDPSQNPQPEVSVGEHRLSIGNRSEVSSGPSGGNPQVLRQNTSTEGISAGSHLSLAPSVTPHESEAQVSLPNAAQYVAPATTAETSILIGGISDMHSLDSTNSQAGLGESPEGKPYINLNRLSRDTISSSQKKLPPMHQRALGKAEEAPFREEMHRSLRPQSTDDPEQSRRRNLVEIRLLAMNTLTRARERVALIEKDQQKAPKFGRCSCWQQWVYKRRLAKAAKGTQETRVWCKLWMGSLQTMEGAFGSAVMLTFAFLRWVFLLNVSLAVLWVGLLVIPYWVKPPSIYKWSYFWKPGFNAVVQGDALERTWVYFGGYFYSRSDQPRRYRVDWAYPFAIAAMFLVSLVAILARIATRILGSSDLALAYKSSVYPFSTVVFASWDFHITSHDAATKLRRSIRTELQEMLADTAIKPRQRKGYTMRERCSYFALFVLWPLSLCSSVAAIVILVKYADKINSKFGTGFGQPLLLAALNIVGPMVTRGIVAIENWKPSVAERVLLVKLYLLRVINLSTLIVRLYMMLNLARRKRDGTSPYKDCSASRTSCGDGFICCTNVAIGEWKLCTTQEYLKCIPACVENTVGKQLIRLIISTALINNGFELILGFGTLLLFKSKRQLAMEDLALDILYLEALVWIGSCFAPVASPLVMLVNILTFYCMKISLMYTCEPLQKRYSASRTSNVTYGLLCCTLVLCSIPASIFLVQRTTPFCGPIRGDKSMYSVLSGYIQGAPGVVWIVLQWLGNQGVLLGIMAILIVSLVLLRATLQRTKQHLQMTKRELELQKREVLERSQFMRSQSMSMVKAYGNRPREKQPVAAFYP